MAKYKKDLYENEKNDDVEFSTSDFVTPNENVEHDYPQKVESVEPIRQMKGSASVHIDLFKLELSYYLKNVGLENKPKWDKAAHCHYYRTYDSSGKKLKNASHIGNHTHEIEYSVTPEGKLVAKCGPPIKVHKNGRTEVLTNKDDHRHQINYLWSEKATVRKLNQRAANHLEMYKNVPLVKGLGDE